MTCHENSARTPWVAYVGPFGYPVGGAAARRIRGVAESIACTGTRVAIASGAGTSTEADEGLVSDGDNIAYCLLPERVAEHWPRPIRRLRYARMGRRTIDWLESSSTLPMAVILYSGYTPYLQQLLPWCRRRGVRLIFDAVEWYEPARPWGYAMSPYQWNIEWAMRRLVPKTDGVIAISRFLADYYANRGLPVVTVPPTTSSIGPGNWKPDRSLRLCYAGTPGANKDDLGTVLRAVSSLAAAREPIHLSVAGPSHAQVMALLGEPEHRFPGWLDVTGPLAHEEVRELIGRVDFTIFSRRQSRVSRAGFPTKFVESLASGTPVIANLSSDLDLHLKDGRTGLVFERSDVESVKGALTRALLMEKCEISRMREACLEHARRAFHPGVYVQGLSSLIAPSHKIRRNP